MKFFFVIDEDNFGIEKRSSCLFKKEHFPLFDLLGKLLWIQNINLLSRASNKSLIK